MDAFPIEKVYEEEQVLPAPEKDSFISTANIPYSAPTLRVIESRVSFFPTPTT